MIPKSDIAKWKDKAPWKSPAQVEQDLVICRALVELFSDDFLREHLAFRGGTALHKLFLAPSAHYSEDIDLVQVKAGPVKPIMERIGKMLDFFEEKRTTRQSKDNNTIMYRFTPEHFPEERMRLKIEINCREHFHVLGWKAFPFEVKSEWFSGKAEITTYARDELLGTKLRALYQRKKGRDLFDLYYTDQQLDLDYDKIISCYEKYIDFAVDKPPTRKQFLRNLEEKVTDPDFEGDMEGLLRDGIEYDQGEAFEWVKKAIIERLK